MPWWLWLIFGFVIGALGAFCMIAAAFIRPWR